MLAFVIRRTLEAILVMLVVALIAFALFRFVGDPINQMVGLETSLEERENSRGESISDEGVASPRMTRDLIASISIAW